MIAFLIADHPNAGSHYLHDMLYCLLLL